MGAVGLGGGVGVFVWGLCGAIGAWILDDLNSRHWKMIAKGPITMVRAINEHPVSIPTQE